MELTLTSVDVAWCKMWAKRMVRDHYDARVVFDAVKARAERGSIIDLTTYEPAPIILDEPPMNASELARELGVRLNVVLDTLADLRVPLVGRGRPYELDPQTVRAVRARIGEAP